jgi:hypothetical protein
VCTYNLSSCIAQTCGLRPRTALDVRSLVLRLLSGSRGTGLPSAAAAALRSLQPAGAPPTSPALTRLSRDSQVTCGRAHAQAGYRSAHALGCAQAFAAHLSSAIDAFNARLESHKWVALLAPMVGRSRAGAATAAAPAQEGQAGDGTAGEA